MMETFSAGQFDIAVIGAGHAGIEAALAAARLGLETIVFTINLDAVGNLPCNPAIGGTGKGHLVRELDALGGEMAKAADECCIQYRLLNLRKGPAVWSLRAQADRRKYQERMKRTLERQTHLTVRQGEVVELRAEGGAVRQVVLSTGAVTWCARWLWSRRQMVREYLISIWAPEQVQQAALKLSELIQKQNAIVCKRYLARINSRSSAD